MRWRRYPRMTQKSRALIEGGEHAMLHVCAAGAAQFGAEWRHYAAERCACRTPGLRFRKSGGVLRATHRRGTPPRHTGASH